MSAFFLYIHDGKELEEKAICSISTKLINFSRVSTSIYSDSNLQLIYTVNKSDKITFFDNKENGLFLFLNGNIFESSSGLEKIDEEIEEYALGRQLINRYLKGGIASCVGLNGMYNLFVWNKRSRILEIAGDRLGIFQIFFTSLSNKRFVVTTDIITLKHIPDYSPKINKRGLFDILYRGIAFENRTILDGVERLVPNSCYSVSISGLKLIQQFRLPFSKKRWGHVTPQILNDLEYYYTQAIKRQLKGSDKLICYLSGGKDSRIFSHFLKDAKIIPHCITIGESHHGEVFLSNKVADTLGFPWRRISCKPNFDPAYIAKFLSIDSFSSRITPTFNIQIANMLADNYDYIISAYLGDPMFGSTILKGKLEKAHNAEDAFNSYFQKSRNGFFSLAELKELFPNDFDEFINDYNKDAFNLFSNLGEELYQMVIAFGLRSNDRFKVGELCVVLIRRYR